MDFVAFFSLLFVTWAIVYCILITIVRMQRKKGQFASSKASSDEVGSASSGWSAAQGPGVDESMVETM